MKIWCIRHGTALHNTLFKLIGKKAYTEKVYTDTPLVEKGEEESLKLGKTWKQIHEINLVFVSPCLRTMQTAHNIFKNRNVKMIALDELTEYPQSVEYCNKRKTVTELKELYPNVDYSLLEETPKYWNDSDIIETEKELLSRVEAFKEIAKKYNKKNVCVVAHSSLLKGLFFGKLEQLEKELAHCFPYQYTITETDSQNLVLS